MYSDSGKNLVRVFSSVPPEPISACLQTTPAVLDSVPVATVTASATSLGSQFDPFDVRSGRLDQKRASVCPEMAYRKKPRTVNGFVTFDMRPSLHQKGLL